MSPTRPRRAAVLPSMSATLRLVAVFALSRRPKMPTALSRRPKMPTAFWACVVCNRARLVLQARCNSDAMENFGTAPDVFLQCYGRYDEQSQPKTDQKIQQSSPTPKVAAVPCVVLAVFVAASSDRLKSKT